MECGLLLTMYTVHNKLLKLAVRQEPRQSIKHTRSQTHRTLSPPASHHVQFSTLTIDFMHQSQIHQGGLSFSNRVVSIIFQC